MFAVESDPEKNGGDCREDQKLQYRYLRYLRPQAHDERSRATDDQETSDDLAPADVALLHEGVEHFRERAARRARWRRKLLFPGNDWLDYDFIFGGYERSRDNCRFWRSHSDDGFRLRRGGLWRSKAGSFRANLFHQLF